METPQQAIRDFLKAVDRGYFGAMPSGFYGSSFVAALREQVANKPLSNGDAHEWMRLLDLSAGHVLTDQDIADIRVLIDDHNDEIGNSADAYHRAREQVLHEIGGEALVKAAAEADEWQSQVAVSKAMEHFYRKSAQYEAEAKSAPSA